MNISASSPDSMSKSDCFELSSFVIILCITCGDDEENENENENMEVGQARRMLL
jgi:hypothetical protein